MTDRYEIRVSGRLGPVLRAAFADMQAEIVPRRIVIEGWLSRDEFRALVLRMENMSGQFIHLDCATGDHHRRAQHP